MVDEGMHAETMPVTMRGTIGSVLFQHKSAEMDTECRRYLLASALQGSTPVAIATSVPFMLLAPVGPPPVFGARFAPSIPSALLLVPAGAILAWAGAAEEGLRGLGRPTIVLTAELAVAEVMVGTLSLLLCTYGIFGAAVASFLGYLTFAIVAVIVISRSTHHLVLLLVTPRWALIKSLVARSFSSLSVLRHKGERVGQTLRVTVLSAYPFHIVDQARQLHRAGVLEQMVTAVPRSRVGLPGKLVSTRLRWSSLRSSARKATSRADPLLNRAVVRDFDRWAASRLKPSVVNALSGFATHTLALASARGIPVFCDRGSWHILEQRRVLDSESDRIGAPRTLFDPLMVESEVREYQLADRILVPSEAARESSLRQGINSGKHIKPPYGGEISAFSPPAQPPPPGCIISVGAVGLRKGQYHLLEAFRMLRTRQASLTLVGPSRPVGTGGSNSASPGSAPPARSAGTGHRRASPGIDLHSLFRRRRTRLGNSTGHGMRPSSHRHEGHRGRRAHHGRGGGDRDTRSAAARGYRPDHRFSFVRRGLRQDDGSSGPPQGRVLRGLGPHGRQPVAAFREGHCE